MNINSPIIKKILSLQIDQSILNEKLMLISLAISTSKLSVIKTILEEYEIEKEEFTALVDMLIKENIITKIDMKLLSKLDNTKIIERDDLEHSVEEVLSHLNAITHTKRKVTLSRKNMIVKWLRQGYSIENFIRVNLLFYYKWHEDPTMEQYIRPETLYNSKFDTRSEEADKEFQKIETYQKEIYDICETYQFFFDNLIVNPSLKYKTEVEFLVTTDTKCKYMPFELQQRIAFWLKKGFTRDQVSKTIEVTIKQWSKKIELYPFINLMKILDRRFPERVNVANRLIETEKMSIHNQDILSLKEWAKS